MDKDIRKQFKILHTKPDGSPLIYLDNAATTQKPLGVIEAMNDFYFHKNANIHRGIYKLSELATNAYETARTNIASFINAKYAHEVIFVRGTTEAINLVAHSYGSTNLKQNDEIIISTMEHHSNIVPWQLISEKTGAKIRVININKNGELDLDHYKKLINERTKMVAVTHISNTLGTINHVKEMAKIAHNHNVPILVDGAQAAPYLKIDVQDLDCDFYAFSAHKMYGPTGIGILYGKEYFLNNMPPYQGGGDMIKKVTFHKTEYADLPQKFEAGTPNIAGVIGLDAAIQFINSIGIDVIAEHEKKLLKYATTRISEIKNLKLIGNSSEKAGILSFVMDKAHPHDVATILDTKGIAVRAGHHCTMPLMDFYGISGTTRASFSIYNTTEEVDLLIDALHQVRKIFPV